MDRSGRWYLTPGARSIYDLRIRNDSKNAVDCSLVVEEPVNGVSVEPQSFALRGHDVTTVTVSFAADAGSVRTHRVLLSLRADDDGAILATFEHPLVVTGGTDCSLALAWKDAIVEGGELRGFALSCNVRSQSEGPSTFQVSFGSHPAFKVSELPAIALQPGQLGEVVIPVTWDRSVKDDKGSNHPPLLEVGVAVSNGRRTNRIRWEQIESKIEPYLKQDASAAPAVASSQNGHANGVATVPTPPVAEASAPTPVAAAKPVPTPVVAAAPAPTPVAAPVSIPVVVAAPVPTPVVAAAPAPTPVAAAAPVPTPVVAAPAAAAAMSAPASPSTATPSPTPLLMLNGHVEPLRLAAPSDARPAAAASANGTASVARSETSKPIETAAKASVSGEVIELPLFPGIVAPSAQPMPASTNGKHAPIESNGAAAVSAPSSGAATPSQPVVPAKPEAAAPEPAKISPPEPVAKVATPEPAAAAVVAPEPAKVATPQIANIETVAPVSAPAQVAAPPVEPVATPVPVAQVATPPTTAAPQKDMAPSPAPPTAPAASAPAPTAPAVGEPAKVEPPQATAAAPQPAAPVQTTTPVAPAQTSQMPAQATSTAIPAQPASTSAPAAPKLTPYATAKWNAEDAAYAPTLVAPAAQDVSSSAPVVTKPVSAKLIRERQMVESTPRRRAVPAGFFIGGLALIALVVAGILFKPTATTQPPSTTPVSVSTPVLALNSAAPAVVQHVQHPQPVVPNKHPTVAKATERPKIQAATPTPHPAATSAPTTTPKPATPRPATPAPATAKPAAQVQPVRAAAPAPAPVHRPRPAQPQGAAVVALGGIEAYYGPRGRTVRVLWSADSQASASVQLMNDSGTTVSTVNVRGGRQNVLMYLPKGYRGGVSVQVSSIGKLGERVAQTTSLPAFGR